MTFAAIHIGSYELLMKIFELSKGKGMRQLDFIRYRLKLGQDSYNYRKLSYETMNVLCDKLKEFQQIMKEYSVKDFRVFATSSIRELDNERLTLDQIRAKTGIKVEVLSNSEQRFLEYMSVAAQEEGFNKIIKKRTAIADVGGGSLQISLFDKDRLVTTQNIKLGTIWISEKVNEMDYRSVKYSEVIEEMIQNDLECFKYLYLNGQDIKNLIVVGELVARIVKTIEKDNDNFITREQYMKFFKENALKNPETVVESIGISKDYSSMLRPTLILLKNLIDQTNVETIWAPGTYLSDGIAYQYAVQNKFIKDQHNFEEDIIAETNDISKRYRCNEKHANAVKEYSDVLFDTCRKLHGLSGRERLLLQIASKLHDCGKYINMSDVAGNSYNIIISTEIIGLSHREREIVANIIYYNTMEMEDKAEILKNFGEEDYLRICKLTSILRIANVLDRSHKQKVKKLKAFLKEQKLTIYADCLSSEFSLEKGMFNSRASLFEEVFGIKPVLKFRINNN